MAIDEEAIGRLRPLAAADPGLFRLSLSRALSGLADRYSDLGRHGEALAAIRECDRVVAEDAVRPTEVTYANRMALLNNMAVILDDLGLHTEAAHRQEEAIDLYRDLAATQAGAYAAEYGTLLNNRAAILCALGRSEEAMAGVREAVRSAWAQLYGHASEAFRQTLAFSLHNLGVMLRNAGQLREAHLSLRRALALYRGLERQEPAVGADVAASLHELSQVLESQERHERAAALASEAIAAYRQRIEAGPVTLRPALARCLIHLGGLLRPSGSPLVALALFDEGCELLADEARKGQSPDHLRTLAEGWLLRSRILSTLGRHEDALQSAEVALESIRRLPGEELLVSDRRQMSRALYQEAACNEQLGRCREAQACLEKSVSLLETLVAELVQNRGTAGGAARLSRPASNAAGTGP